MVDRASTSGSLANQSTSRTAPGACAQPSAAPAGKRISSAALFGELTEIEIEHNSLVYRLRKTSQGKLILTK